MANKLTLSAVGLLSLLAAGTFAQTATTDPVGFQRKDCPVGYTGFSTPLVGAPLFVGRVIGNTNTSVAFEGSDLHLANAIAAAGPVYLEVISGALEGDRVDLDEASTISSNNGTVMLDLAATHNTMSPSANLLVGSTCALRSHVTLGSLQAMFTPELVGNNNYAQADRVYVFESGSWVRHYLRGDKHTWRVVGGQDDLVAKVIPPGTGILVEMVGTPKSVVQTGAVRMNAFRVNLVAGTQCFALPYPVDMSPVQLAAFKDPNEPVGDQWYGQNDPTKADTLSPYTASGFLRYYLRADGTSWRISGDQKNYANDPIVGYNAPVLLKRTNPNSGYVVLRPFNP